MEKKFNEIGTNILHRITSPWFFTFIPWWVVFNYDFLLCVFGKFDTVDKINKYYDTIRKVALFEMEFATHVMNLLNQYFREQIIGSI